MVALAKGHATGTHRIVPPSMTLDRITPLLPRFGITRCADITGLDRIGIPVYVGVRPHGRILQTSNGKGLTATDAKVSALMEAIEHWHAEHPQLATVRCALGDLEGDVLSPRGIDGCPPVPVSRRRIFDWVRGTELRSGAPAWLPAFAAGYTPELPYAFSFNGLASGNHTVEATLHALYEVVERDTLARIELRGNVRLDRCGVVDLDRCRDDAVGGLAERIRTAGFDLVLLSAPCAARIHTMVAVILDRHSFGGAALVNFGSGAHLSPTVAAIRAITEAAQSRLTFIHGSREDLDPRAYERGPVHEALLAYFAQMTADTAWDALPDHATSDVGRDLAAAIADVRTLGFTRIYMVNLGQGIPGVHAVKVIVPGARLARWIA